jgi:hypothetical protein
MNNHVPALSLAPFLPIGEILLVVLVLVFGLRAIKTLLGGAGKERQREGANFLLRDSLFTPAETAFLACLDAVVSSEIRIFAKIRLEDIFAVEEEKDFSRRQSGRNRISSRHVDFLLCRADDLAFLVAIELDDSSHARAGRGPHDAFKDKLFADAGLPLLRVPARASYNLDDLAQRLREALPQA